MEDKRKVMVILWKWTHLKHINGTNLDANFFEQHIQNPNLGEIGSPSLQKNEEEGDKNAYFKFCNVEPSTRCPNAVVVQVSIYKDNDATRDLFESVLKHILLPEDDILVFLHRGNMYNETDVSRLRGEFSKYQMKCLLFAVGRDAIYYPTQQCGLLNDKGQFFKGRDRASKEYIEIFDKEKNWVQQPYFERCWSHYSYEFKNKTLALKEETCNAWAYFFLPNYKEKITVVQLREQLNEQPERVLWYRMRSFLGRYKMANSETNTKQDADIFAMPQEREDIEELEKKDGVSYIFDDAIANIESDLIKDTYAQTVNSFEFILSNNDDSMIDQQTLRAAIEQMNTLIQVMPG